MSSVSIRLLRNASWNLVDQVLSALTNIVLAIVVARSVSAAGFGAFASAFVVFGISIAVTKSIVGQPLQMRFSDATPDQRHDANVAALGCALALGLAAGLLVAVTALAVSGSVGSALLALAIVLPGLLVQDSCRMAAFALGRPSLAALMDAVWAIVQFGLIAVLVLTLAQVRAVVQKRPKGFGDHPETYHSDAVFLIGIDAAAAMKVFDPRPGVDEVWPGAGVIYSQRLSAERTKSRLGKIAGTPPYKSMTIRSWQTTLALLERMEAPGQ